MEELTKPVLVETLPNGIEIYFVPLVEHISIYDNLFEPEDAKQIVKQIDNSEVEYFCAKVFAEYKGIEIASDYLGCCIYDSFEDFYIKYKDEYFAGMREKVIKEGIEYLKGLQQELNTINLC